MKIVILVSLLSCALWVSSTKSKTIHLHTQCNTKFSILPNCKKKKRV